MIRNYVFHNGLVLLSIMRDVDTLSFFKLAFVNLRMVKLINEPAGGNEN
jgi:hypothetical protein